MVSSTGKSTPLRPGPVRVIAAADAAKAGWVARPIAHSFGPGRDGTELVSALIAEAGQAGALAVSDIGITLAVPGADGPTECRTSILPETVAETRTVPASYRLVPVQRPVSRLVTEQQYRCHSESHAETRWVTEYQQALPVGLASGDTHADDLFVPVRRVLAQLALGAQDRDVHRLREQH